MTRRWEEFLREAAAPGHGVEIYSDAGELAESVARFLAEGFARGEPAIVVATGDHLSSFRELLVTLGHDPADLERRGLFVTADAGATLASIMERGEPSAEAFDNVIGGLLDRVGAQFPGQRPRVFGEMVDLLCARGESVAAFALEELWNDLGRRRDFALLCGYQLDVFDREAQAGLLPDVCRLHSHVLPAHDQSRLAKAVDVALEEVLGAAGAGQVYVLIGDRMRIARVPTPQLALMWVSANMPLLAERVLTAARDRYRDMPATQPVEADSVEPRPNVDPGWRSTLRAATRARPALLFNDTE